MLYVPQALRFFHYFLNAFFEEAERREKMLKKLSSKSGQGALGVILSLCGSLLTIFIILHVLKMFGLNIDLGAAIADGILQLRDAFDTVKDAL